jgi:predicted ATPase/signal transduction histidine kinase/ActR/RegA family two-component response regulator
MVHAHLAEEALLSDFLPHNIPKILGSVVEKMLYKQPEKRYQRGFGLLSDLGKCKTIWAENKLNTTFSLGLDDRSHRVTFISKMVGRDQEAEIILKDYGEVIKGKFKSMLISGVSGIGKTRLIQELQKPIIKNKGYFTSGKFDVYQKNVPYSSLIQAFRNLIRTYLTESDERVALWKNKIQNAVGTNGSILTDIIPELLVLLGPQPEVQKISPVEARNRFNLIFSRFLESLASRDTPLVLFIDDLQWCDIASFDFLTNIFLSSDDHPCLFLLGAYRHNEVDDSHPLTKLITFAKQNKKPLNEIRIGPILEKNTHEMVSYILDEELSLTKDLGVFLHNLTEGNPLFVSESLSYLYNEGLLYYNSESKQWKWNIEKIRNSDMPLTVVGLFSSKVKQLPPQTIALLEYCACLGNLFTPNELALVKELQLIDIYEILKPVLGIGLLIENKDQLQFIHDKVQEATLELTNSKNRKNIHWEIGKHLLAALPEHANLEKLDNIFTITSHLNMAHKLSKNTEDILPESEKLLLYQLNYSAGNSALNSLATYAANEYYLMSLELLPPETWNKHYEFTYKVYQKLAKTELMVGRYDSSEKLLNELLANAQTDIDKAEALAEQTTSLSSIGNFIKAIEAANKGLSYFNKSIPLDSNLAKEQCLKLMKEIHDGDRDVWKAILQMPFTTDRKNKVELTFYSELIPDLYMSGLVDQLYLSAAQSTQHCLNGGMDESVIYSFSIMGLNLGEQEQFQLAFQYEDLAKNLCEKYPNTFGATRGMNGVVWCNMHSRSPPNEIVTYCLKSIQSGKNCGDLYNAGLSYGPLLWNLQVKGSDFKEIEKYAQECFEFSKKFQLSFSVGLAEAMSAGWVLPMKKNYTPDSMDKKIKTWEAANHIASIGSYYVHLALSLYYFGQYEEAEISIEKVRSYLHGLTDNVLKRQWYVLQILNAIKLFEIQSPPISKESLFNKINPILDKLKKWAELGPLLRPYLKFARAEIERIQFGIKNAWNEYFDALSESHTMGYTFFEGFIYENLADLAQIENNSLSQIFSSNALILYQSCQAERKIYALYEKFRHLITQDDSRLHFISDISANIDNQNIKDIDDFYFIKASQAISAEIDKESLMSKSIEIFTDSTGAQYGIIALVHNSEIFKCTDYFGKISNYFGKISNYFNKDKVQKKIEFSLLNNNIQGLLRYVLRVKDSVVINNKNQSDFYKDFIDTSIIKAIFCLPIIRKNNVMGIVYLESRISDSVFTPKEVDMVKLLSLQTGISLENANLYEEIQQENQIRKKIEEDLHKAKNNAEVANISKSQFLANMSHEIRTPLHSIIGVTECLIQAHLTDEQNYLVKVAQASSENLLHIINDILDISRIESGNINMEKIEFSLHTEIKKCIDIINIRAKEKNINLKWVFSKNLEDNRIGDPTRLRQVLINLLSNAIKFSEEGTVTLSVSSIIEEPEQPNILFSVKDQGIGIASDKLLSIFDRFRQTDDSMTRRFGGSGLGLTISKKIIELMNGKIWVESKVGLGSTFRFKIYLPIYLKNKKQTDQDILESNTRKHSTHSSEQIKIKPLHILLVDDAPDNRLIFKKYLFTLPYQIITAVNGEEAILAFKNAKYDLVFMDIQMPIMDGYTATKQIRDWEKSNHLSETPIIALTAHAFEDDIIASLEAGCSDHIVKPLKREKLISIIEKYTSGQTSEYV